MNTRRPLAITAHEAGRGFAIFLGGYFLDILKLSV
jgi:hypothetical protein